MERKRNAGTAAPLGSYERSFPDYASAFALRASADSPAEPAVAREPRRRGRSIRATTAATPNSQAKPGSPRQRRQPSSPISGLKSARRSLAALRRLDRLAGWPREQRSRLQAANNDQPSLFPPAMARYLDSRSGDTRAVQRLIQNLSPLRRAVLAEPQGLELPGAAEAPQIGRHDRLHRALLDAEALEGAALVCCGQRYHVVLAQELDLVGGEQRLRPELQDGRLQPGQPEGNRHQQAAALDRRQREFHQLAETEDLWPAELVGRARPGRALDRGQEGRRHVAGEDRLEARVAAADQRQSGQEAGEGGELVEEVVVRPEHDRGPEDRRARRRGARRLLARRLRARVGRGRILVGAERRHVDQASTVLGGGERDRLRPEV